MSETVKPPFYRDQQARWYANRHFDFDDGVTRIFYLPTNAPESEIRFLEVNQLIPETPPEPIDFGIDRYGTNPHTLVVFDVTPSQWDAIQKGEIALPSGWSLNGYKEFDRPKKNYE